MERSRNDLTHTILFTTILAEIEDIVAVIQQFAYYSKGIGSCNEVSRHLSRSQSYCVEPCAVLHIIPCCLSTIYCDIRDCQTGRLNARRSLVNTYVVHEDSTTAIVTICKELNHNRIACILSQADDYLLECIRSRITGTGRILRICRIQCHKVTSVYRDLHSHVTTVSRMRIVERQLVSDTLRQCDRRGIDQQCTTLSTIVVRTQHLIVTALVNTEHVVRIGSERSGSRSRVIPASRNAIYCIVLEVVIPRERSNHTTVSCEADYTAERALSLFILRITPSRYLSIIRYAHLQTIDQDRVIGRNDRLTPLLCTALLVAYQPSGFVTLWCPSKNSRVISQQISHSLQTIRLHAGRDCLYNYILNTSRSQSGFSSQHLDSYILAVAGISGERNNILRIGSRSQFDRVKTNEGRRISRIGHNTNSQNCVLRSSLYVVASIELETHILQTDQLRQDKIFVLRLITYLRSEVQELAAAVCILRIVG